MTTDVLSGLRSGAPDSLGRLVPLVYRELRDAAHSHVVRGGGGALDTTALVQATYRKLVDQSQAQWSDRAQFLAVAAVAMRQVLVDQARERRALTGNVERPFTLDDAAPEVNAQAAALMWLDEVLTHLAGAAPRIARVVDCRFFGGMTERETAGALGVDVSTIRRDWSKALMLLRRHESASGTGDAAGARTPQPLIPADWQRIEPLLDALLDAPADRRVSLLHDLSGEDLALRSQLDALVKDCEHGAPLLERPAAERFASLYANGVEYEAVARALAERYHITRELGRGGMAVVYLARDVKHGREVAVKVVHPEIAAALGRERFLREIEIVARLHHPHIVPLYDSGESGGVLYYVMPYEPGHSLRDRLTRERQMPIADAVAILRDVCDALAYAHEQGIVHRDIKPDNVLLSGRHAVVTDFGVARAMSTASGHAAITVTGVTLGTPAYMSPEQIVADPGVDHRADIYAFGVLAYEMLTGHPPFVRDASHRVLSAHLTEVPDHLGAHRSDVPRALDELVMKCLAKRPEERWQDAGAMLAQLESVAGTRAVGGRAARLAVVGLAVLVAGGGVALLMRRDLPRLTIDRAAPFTTDAGLELYPMLSPDGRFVAYSAGTSARMRILVRAVSGGRTWTLSNDTSAIETHPAWSPDGGQILFLSRGGASVAPAFGGAVRPVAPRSTSAPVRAASWSPDGREIAIVRGDSVLLYSADGSRSRFVARGTEWHSCAWSPTRTWLACVAGNPRYAQPGAFFGNLGPSAIVLVRTTDGHRVVVTDSAAPSTNQSPTWSADGSRLLFVSDRDGARDIFAVAIDADGRTRGGPDRLTTGLNVHSLSLDVRNGRLAYALYQEKANLWSLPIPDRPPTTAAAAEPVTTGSQVVEIMRISHGGKWLYYDSNLHGNSDVFRVPLSQGEPERLTNHPSPDFAADASPDGSEFAYHRFGGGHRDVFVQRISDGRAEQITSTDAQECCPAWSPDGRSLAIAHFDSDGGIFVMRRDATGRWSPPVRRLARGFLHAWSPDGTRIAVASGRTIRGTDHAERLELIRPDSGEAVTLYAVADTVNDPIVGDPQWAADGRGIYFKSHDPVGRASIWYQALAGGRPRLLVRFDDLARPSFRPNFTTDGVRFFFTINARESDIWLADLTSR
jgi:RNA polymerase sigma factor (TIGR02999 family)